MHSSGGIEDLENSFCDMPSIYFPSVLAVIPDQPCNPRHVSAVFVVDELCVLTLMWQLGFLKQIYVDKED